MLQDEVWRLEKIGKDGAFHKKLSKEGINTVQDFLKLSVVDPRRLRQVYIYTLNFLTLFCNRYNEILIFPVFPDFRYWNVRENVGSHNQACKDL